MEATRDEVTGRWSLSGVESSEITFDRMCQMLRDGINFKFARYGDGEFNCMFGKAGHNCDGHEYFPDLGTALNNAFYSDPKYMVGIQPLSVQGGMYQRAIQREGYPKNIYDADVLHSASIDGKLQQFFAAMVFRHVVLIGPKHLENVVSHCNHIQIPDINCWSGYENICYEIDLAFGLNSVFLLCASMMSEVIIHRYRNLQSFTMIDCGSVLDPYAGKLSRIYHHKLAL